MEHSQSIGPWSTMPPPAWPGFTSRRAPSPVFFIEAPGRPVFLLPSGYEGMARQGALPSSVQYPHLLAEMRKRLPARHPNIFEMPGLICGRLLPFRPHVVNGIACAGPRFPGTVLIGVSRSGLPFASPSGLPSLSDGLSGKKLRASLNGCTVSQLLAGGSYWPPGGAPAPPECLGGAFVSRPRAPHPAPSSDASR